MPGESDCANQTLPQQPLNRCLLPKSSKLSTLHCVSNPYEFQLNDVNFLGHSGQSVDNIVKHMDVDRLDLLERLLRWRHICPTAPDLLFGFPSTVDPFVIEQTPHVFFVGNQPEFATKQIKGNSGEMVRLILLPAFSTSHTIVILNLDTLDCQPISFHLYDDHD